MGLLGSDSTSKAEDNRQAGTDNATVVRGRGNLSVKDQAKAVGAKGKLIESGSADFSGATLNTGVLGGSKFAAGGNVTVGDTTGAGVKAAGDISSKGFDALTTAFKTNNETLLSVLDKQNTVTGDVFGTVSSLAQNQQSGGAYDQRKTLLWVGGLLGAFVLLFLLFKK